MQIFEAVETDAAATAERREKAVAAKDDRDHAKNRALLFTYFPQAPKAAADEILGHGFLKGSGRVGRKSKLDQKLRVTLAVNAHVRHALTPYELILADASNTRLSREEAKQVARDQVHDQVHAIADSWRSKRGEDAKGKPKKRSANRSPPRPEIKSSAATLANNRSRRKTQKAQESQEPLDRVAKTLEEILSHLKLSDTSEEAIVKSVSGKHADLSVLDGRKLSGSEIRERVLRRVQEDLEKFRRDPNHPMKGLQLSKVIKMLEENGENVADFGPVAVARAEEQKRFKMEALALKRARRNVARNIKKKKPIASEDATLASTVGPNRRRLDLELLHQSQIDPNFVLGSQVQRRISRWQEEERKQNKSLSHDHKGKGSSDSRIPAEPSSKEHELIGGSLEESEWMDIS